MNGRGQKHDDQQRDRTEEHLPGVQREKVDTLIPEEQFGGYATRSRADSGRHPQNVAESATLGPPGRDDENQADQGDRDAHPLNPA